MIYWITINDKDFLKYIFTYEFYLIKKIRAWHKWKIYICCKKIAIRIVLCLNCVNLQGFPRYRNNTFKIRLPHVYKTVENLDREKK